MHRQQFGVWRVGAHPPAYFGGVADLDLIADPQVVDETGSTRISGQR